jgi:hypothetical protein
VDESVSRNLTLILKSQFPVRWYLESWGLAGNLEAISNNGPVENYSLSSGQHLRIVRRPLPEAFEQLWKSIIVDTGSTPVSYVKVELANVLSMVIPPRSKRGSYYCFEQQTKYKCFRSTCKAAYFLTKYCEYRLMGSFGLWD